MFAREIELVLDWLQEIPSRDGGFGSEEVGQTLPYCSPEKLNLSLIVRRKFRRDMEDLARKKLEEERKWRKDEQEAEWKAKYGFDKEDPAMKKRKEQKEKREQDNKKR